MIIGLVGEKLAGKDTVADYLTKKYTAAHFRFTHILDEILHILNLSVSRRNEIDLGLNLRKVFGDHVLVSALHKRMETADGDVVVVNGIRMDEFDVVKTWPGATIIYITAPAEIRFQRYLKRREKADDGVMNFQDFVNQEKEPTEIGIPSLGKRADFKIENTGSLEELYEKIDKIVNKL